MATVKIEGVPGLNGEYPLDLDHLTNRDMHTIKTVAGVAGLELEGAFEKGDLDMFVALAAIALRKAGKPFHIDQLWDAELGKVIVDFTEDEQQEADAGPPALSAPDGSESSAARPPSSGLTSNGSSESPAAPLSRIGVPL